MINPLGQHLPFPMNVNAPQEASPPHDYLTFKLPPADLGQRRATLPDTQSLNIQVKRLDTWEERHDGEPMPSPQIGVALSSPIQVTHSAQSKRRSRSATDLRDWAKGRPSIERRRSAEIRYWRNSHASASVYSSHTPRPLTAQTVDTVISRNTKDIELKPSGSVTEVTEITTISLAPPAVEVAQHDQDISQIQLSVSAFNFGNLRSGFSDDEDSTRPTVEQSRAQSPSQPRSTERRLSIEDRVKHLEEGMRTLETSVNRLSGRNNRQTIILDNAPKGRRSSRNRSSSGASEHRQERHHSSSRSRPTSTLYVTEPELHAPGSPTLAPLSAVNEDMSTPRNSHANTKTLNPPSPLNRNNTQPS
jgi:hypothetical protein